jgi:hypothetical protein
MLKIYCIYHILIGIGLVTGFGFKFSFSKRTNSLWKELLWIVFWPLWIGHTISLANEYYHQKLKHLTTDDKKEKPAKKNYRKFQEPASKETSEPKPVFEPTTSAVQESLPFEQPVTTAQPEQTEHSEATDDKKKAPRSFRRHNPGMEYFKRQNISAAPTVQAPAPPMDVYEHDEPHFPEEEAYDHFLYEEEEQHFIENIAV